MTDMNGERNQPTRFHGKVFVSDADGVKSSRPSQDFIGKPVISLDDGRRVGTVSDIAIDRDTLQIAAIATSKGSLFNRRMEAIMASNVKVWGEDVVLVSGSDVVIGEERLAGRDRWLYVGDSIRGRTVISVDGTRVGQVNDVIVDRSGRIVGYELNQVFIDGPLSETRRIPSSATHSLGKDVLIVNTIEGLTEKG